MNTRTLANLFVICSAPVVDPCAPLAITVTARGRRQATERARSATHSAPVPIICPRQTMQPASCRACGLCNIHGELTCSDCEETKQTANATRIEADR